MVLTPLVEMEGQSDPSPRLTHGRITSASDAFSVFVVWPVSALPLSILTVLVEPMKNLLFHFQTAVAPPFA